MDITGDVMTVKLGRDTVVIIRAAVVAGARGNERTFDWDNATRTVVKYCNVQPFLLTDKLKIEEGREREFAEDTWRVWAPAGTDIRYTDRVEFQDEEYEVRGLPGLWRDLDGKSSHVNFMIRKRVG